ncbi:cleft lip and palate transmembrane protein 1 [Tanacetum coccineum]
MIRKEIINKIIDNYLPKSKANKKKSLLGNSIGTNEDEAFSESKLSMDVYVAQGVEEPEADSKDDGPTEYISYWKPNITINLVDDFTNFFKRFMLQEYLYIVTSTVHLCPVIIVVDVPEEISKLKSMQRLISAINIIGHLPMNLGKHQSIKFIMLDGNQLTTLPDH